MKRIFIIFLLFFTVISITFSNFYHRDKKIKDKNYFNDNSNDILSYMGIQTFANEKHKIKRILADIRVNTWTNNDQTNPKVSSLSNGNFVVVWQSYLEGGLGWSIYGQIFYNNGAKKGNEFAVSNYNTFNQTNPNIAASSSGKFLVAWSQSDGNIYGRIFMNDGTKLNDEFQINTIINSISKYQSITALKNNNFVVSWSNVTNIFAQIFTDNGSKLGNQLNIASNQSCNNPTSIKSLANGNFIVTYKSYNNIFANIFLSNGIPLNSQIIISNSWDYTPSIASISNSNFMVVCFGQDDSSYGIYGQILTSFGIKIGNKFRVNTYSINDQRNPSITSLENDNYIVTWQSFTQDGNSWGVYGQILDSTGNKIGNEFRINSNMISTQQNPSVSSLINNNFVVVWESDGQDGNGYGIFGNIYRIDGLIIGFNACPLNCQSCTNSTNCIACDPNFKMKLNGLCGCFDGLYFDMSSSSCISKFII